MDYCGLHRDDHFPTAATAPLRLADCRFDPLSMFEARFPVHRVWRIPLRRIRAMNSPAVLRASGMNTVTPTRHDGQNQNRSDVGLGSDFHDPVCQLSQERHSDR